MPVTELTTDPEALTMTLIADVDAPGDRLWRAFTEPRQLERIWGPPGWPATFTEFDFTVGGRARYHMPHRGEGRSCRVRSSPTSRSRAASRLSSSTRVPSVRSR